MPHTSIHWSIGLHPNTDRFYKTSSIRQIQNISANLSHNLHTKGRGPVISTGLSVFLIPWNKLPAVCLLYVTKVALRWQWEHGLHCFAKPGIGETTGTTVLLNGKSHVSNYRNPCFRFTGTKRRTIISMHHLQLNGRNLRFRTVLALILSLERYWF